MRISDWSSDVCSSDLAGSHGMSAIALQQSRMARIEQYQRIAQMQPRNRTTRAFQQATFLRARERDGRPMQLVLDLGGDQANDTFVPVILKHADAGGIAVLDQQ